jgi:hypothetical protein
LIQPDEPPPYSSGTGPPEASTSTSDSGVVFGPASCFFENTQINRSIKGAWAIDTSVNIPGGKPINESKEQPSLYLKSHNGSVVADVKIVGGHATRVIIETISQNGSVKVTLVSVAFYSRQRP